MEERYRIRKWHELVSEKSLCDKWIRKIEPRKKHRKEWECYKQSKASEVEKNISESDAIIECRNKKYSDTYERDPRLIDTHQK